MAARKNNASAGGGLTAARRAKGLTILLAASLVWTAAMEVLVFHWFDRQEEGAGSLSPLSGGGGALRIDPAWRRRRGSSSSSSSGGGARDHHHLPLLRLRAKEAAGAVDGGDGSGTSSGRQGAKEGAGGKSRSGGSSSVGVLAPDLVEFKQFELESDGRADDEESDGGDRDRGEAGKGGGDDNGEDGSQADGGVGDADAADEEEEGDDGKEDEGDDERGAHLDDEENPVGGDRRHGGGGNNEGNDDEEKDLLAIGDDPIGGRAAAAAETKRKGQLPSESKNLMLEEQDDASNKERGREGRDGNSGHDEDSGNDGKKEGKGGDPKDAEDGVEPNPKPQIEVDWSLAAAAAASSRNVSLFPSYASRGAVSVLILPQLPAQKRKANSVHLIYDGIRESPVLNFTDDVNDTAGVVVWVIDLLAAREEWVADSDDDTTTWCRRLASLIEEAQRVRRGRGQPAEWPIAIVDNRDYPIISTCVEIGNAVGDHNVRYSYRSAIKLRVWNENLPWVRPGKLLDRDSFPRESKYEYRHRPIGVRTDTVEAVQSIVRESHGLKLCHPIEELNRTVDVAYLWEFQNFTRSHASLRDTVYLLLEDLRRNRSDWNMVVGPRGEMARRGRKQVSDEYVETLLDSKIVVVAQRDKWEDHYRLFEAMVAGALVLTDRMLSLPRGLKAGESVVEYKDADDLRSKLSHYLRNRDERLAIAKRARFVAMANHRSWHHMEEVVFGSPVTGCSESTGSACPFIVHAHQINESC